jgi:hypothetical protein
VSSSTRSSIWVTFTLELIPWNWSWLRSIPRIFWPYSNRNHELEFNKARLIIMILSRPTYSTVFVLFKILLWRNFIYETVNQRVEC